MSNSLKTIALFLFSCALSTTVFAKSTATLVEYDFGNQITRSALKIFSDGTIEHSERICCPPTSKPVPEVKLTVKELDQLNEWIEDSQEGEIKIAKGGPTTMGSSSGTLYAYNQKKQKVALRIVERDQEIGKSNKVSYNDSRPAASIQKLVEDHVDVLMSDKQ